MAEQCHPHFQVPSIQAMLPAMLAISKQTIMQTKQQQTYISAAAKHTIDIRHW
jgi:hypothetical protein